MSQIHTFVRSASALLVFVAITGQALGDGVQEYGDEDVLGTGVYPIDPKTGATLQGLATDASTFGAGEVNHSFPFSPSSGDYAGTDQIYIGSTQTASHDGYSNYAGRIAGPQVITMDYSSLVSPGDTIQTLTLGIGFDDFQQVPFHQPFSLSVNGVANTVLTNTANGLDQTGPQVQFCSFGIDPSILLGSHILTLTVDEGGDGGDGWAIDFLTIGVTTVPAPSSAALMAVAVGFASRRRR